MLTMIIFIIPFYDTASSSIMDWNSSSIISHLTLREALVKDHPYPISCKGCIVLKSLS